MLYFRALIQGLDDIPAIDPAIRADIETEARRSGWPVLHQQLSEVDPETAGRLHPNHSQRICRALEVYRGTGMPLSKWQQGNPAPASDAYECIALCPEDRAVLHARIASRLDAMFDQGLVAEVTRLHKQQGLHTDLPAIRAVGYRQVWSYLEGEIDLTTCREKVLAATRQLAKRQLTWLRGWPDLTWIWTDEAGQLIGGGNPAVGATDSNDYGLSAPAEGIWFGRLQELMRNF
jgi:tRNA dimethylallyltransferase